MKKFLALMLAILTVLSCAVVASASEVAGTQQLTITYTEPEATYTLNIPQDTTIDLKNNDLSIAYATLTGSANFWGKRLEVLMQPDGFTDKSGTDTVTNALYNFTMTLADGSTVDDLMLTFGELADTSTGALVTNPQSNGQSITDMDLHFYIGAGPAFQNAIEGLDYTSTIQFNAAVVKNGETSPFDTTE